MGGRSVHPPDYRADCRATRVMTLNMGSSFNDKGPYVKEMMNNASHHSGAATATPTSLDLKLFEHGSAILVLGSQRTLAIYSSDLSSSSCFHMTICQKMDQRSSEIRSFGFLHGCPSLEFVSDMLSFLLGGTLRISSLDAPQFGRSQCTIWPFDVIS
ncbi:uncharacterized protein EI90DRAFT_3088334 [Cantharellus anzutake]|uniref:uncharacterized protein n=1 Tax=Cantharellus anzutake TaxID=1750568 RepID=UPI001906F192|nr:uncharacterized protein EI90DRAFT_3088334 [Cantharellus anzutake]KAF8315498.1 hypothetical protein EI90DRAFT_3088334 [Cantharellus anzutake]